MSATLSCPETARLFLATPHPLAYQEAPTPERLPARVATPLHNSHEHALHEACMALVHDDTMPPSGALAHLIHHAYRWQEEPREAWRLDALLPLKEERTEKKASDPIALIYALSMLALMGDMPPRPRLLAVLARMESALAIRIDHTTRALATTPETPAHLAALDMCATEAAHPWLSAWLALQLSAVAFPFGGLHRVGVRDRITLIAVRYATLRLALACHPDMQGEECVDIIQPLARLVDHQADHAPALRLAQDAGWGSEARLRGLVSAS